MKINKIYYDSIENSKHVNKRTKKYFTLNINPLNNITSKSWQYI